jgi:hypothetical protein
MASGREYVPMQTFTDGFGPLDARIVWHRGENGVLIMDVVSQNGEHACGIRLPRAAIVDLIAELAKSL